MLPFTTEAFSALFAQYNAAIWPAQIVAYASMLVVLLLVLRPLRGGGRLIGAILAAAWAWNGLVYHWMHFATLNFVAPAFAVLFIVQALLFCWTATIRGKPAFRFTGDLAGWIGLGLAVFAMIGYPLLAWLAGHGWPRAALVGVAPCPTTIFTMGLLLLTTGRTPLHLVVIPVLWSLVGGTSAWLLGIPEDITLLLAGVGGLCVIVWKNWRSDRRDRSAGRAAKKRA